MRRVTLLLVCLAVVVVAVGATEKVKKKLVKTVTKPNEIDRDMKRLEQVSEILGRSIIMAENVKSLELHLATIMKKMDEFQASSPGRLPAQVQSKLAETKAMLSDMEHAVKAVDDRHAPLHSNMEFIKSSIETQAHSSVQAKDSKLRSILGSLSKLASEETDGSSNEVVTVEETVGGGESNVEIRAETANPADDVGALKSQLAEMENTIKKLQSEGEAKRDATNALNLAEVGPRVVSPVSNSEVTRIADKVLEDKLHMGSGNSLDDLIHQTITAAGVSGDLAAATAQSASPSSDELLLAKLLAESKTS